MTNTAFIRQTDRPAIANNLDNDFDRNLTQPVNDTRLSTHVLLIPSLILAYIFNGEQDPRKVCWLYAVLSTALLLVGVFVNSNLLLVAVIMLAITLINRVNVWLLKKLSGDVWASDERKYFASISDFSTRIQ